MRDERDGWRARVLITGEILVYLLGRLGASERDVGLFRDAYRGGDLTRLYGCWNEIRPTLKPPPKR